MRRVSLLVPEARADGFRHLAREFRAGKPNDFFAGGVVGVNGSIWRGRQQSTPSPQRRGAPASLRLPFGSRPPNGSIRSFPDIPPANERNATPGRDHPTCFWNGKMAIDGLSGSGSGAGSAEAAGGAAAAAPMRMRWACTGRAMFLTCCSPMSSNAKASLSRTWSRTTRLTQMPPGSAKVSSRAATLTPSPKMSPPSTWEEFAPDSPLEGDGFELLVPRHESPGFSAHGGRSLPDSPLEETGFEPEVPAREGWVPLAEGEPSQRRQQAAETVPYLRGPSVRIPVAEAGGRPPPLVFGLD